MNRLCSVVLVLFVALSTASCLTWAPGWKQPPIRGAEVGDLTATDRATTLIADADTREKVLAAITASERAIEAEPNNSALFARAGRLHCLLGAGYETSVAAKKRAYLQAIRLSEQAMGANLEFRRAIEAGRPFDEAVASLGPTDMDTMLIWATGVSYLFKECQSPPQKVINFRWMSRARAVMERMLTIEPDWDHGVVHFTLGIYYLALPKSAGGDMAKAREFISRAIELGPNHLLFRWGRAKYWAVKAKDRTLFESDLRWVVAQNPRTALSPYAWNVYFQRDARRALGLADQ